MVNEPFAFLPTAFVLSLSLSPSHLLLPLMRLAIAVQHDDRYRGDQGDPGQLAL